jgi:hypothetical protein
MPECRSTNVKFVPNISEDNTYDTAAHHENRIGTLGSETKKVSVFDAISRTGARILLEFCLQRLSGLDG